MSSAANMKLIWALSDPLWKNRSKDDRYTMDGKPAEWKIFYYPIFEDGKTQEAYTEPRALIERKIPGGYDFREVPLRYLTKK